MAEHEFLQNWKPSELPPPATHSRKCNNSSENRTAATIELLNRFIDSEDICWSKEYEPDKGLYNQSKAARSNASFMGLVAQAMAVPVLFTQRGTVLYMINTELAKVDTKEEKE